VLLEKVLVTIRDIEIKEDRFKIIKERVLWELKNWDFKELYNQVATFTSWLNSEKEYINKQFLAKLDHLTAANI
jgi:insulysin